MAQHHGDLPVEVGAQLCDGVLVQPGGEPVIGAGIDARGGGVRRLGNNHRESKVLVVGEELGRILDVGFGDKQQRIDPGVVRGHQGAVDKPGPRLGIGGRHHDHQLVGVGDDGPLDRVRVVGAAPQQGPAVLDPDQPGQGVGLAADVADQRNEVAGHYRVAAQFAGAGGDDLPFCPRAFGDDGGVASAVNGNDPPGHGIVVAGPVLGAGPGAFFVGADPGVGFVPGISAACHRRRPSLPGRPLREACFLR
ncbi:hypothetical protein BJQ89_01506 [Arthrobacter sp. ES1]|nr:hypothetical protein [Arthrobacter sp. ES1]